MPPATEYDILIRLEGVQNRDLPDRLTTFCRLAQASMESRGEGYRFPKDIECHFTRKPDGTFGDKALILFDEEPKARKFYYDFHNFVWGSNDGTQQIVVRLYNDVFQRECSNHDLRICAAEGLEYAKNIELTEARMLTDKTPEGDDDL